MNLWCWAAMWARCTFVKIALSERFPPVLNGVVVGTNWGTLADCARLAIQLTRIMTSDGKTLDIQTNTIAMTGGTSYGKKAAKVAAMAGVGAAIGGLAGGRGLVIGSVMGATAGVRLAMNSRAKATTVASETRLEFHLIAPVTFTSIGCFS